MDEFDGFEDLDELLGYCFDLDRNGSSNACLGCHNGIGLTDPRKEHCGDARPFDRRDTVFTEEGHRDWCPVVVMWLGMSVDGRRAWWLGEDPGRPLPRDGRAAPECLLLTVEQFNKLIPTGSAVRYYPVAGEPRFEDTRTRSEAWALGNGEVVVKVEGRTGGVCVSHLELRESAAFEGGVHPACRAVKGGEQCEGLAGHAAEHYSGEAAWTKPDSWDGPVVERTL